MEIIQDLKMRGETVRLDDRHFIDCTFTDCILEYSGSEVILERTSMRGCRHALHGPAFLTAQYLSAVGLLPDTELKAAAEFAELVQ